MTFVTFRARSRPATSPPDVLRRCAVLFALCLTMSVAGQTPPRAAGPALSEIQGPHIAAHLRFLAHDLLEGRAPGTRGGELAAEYIAAQFATLGLAPGAPESGYFQPVPIVESELNPSFVLKAVPTGPIATGERTYRYLDEVVAFSGLLDERLSVRGDLVFVGHGVVAPEYRWNDYEGVDVKGKIALVMVNDPPAPANEPDLFGARALTYYGRWTYKFEEAARQGAAGAILIHTPESATYPWQVVRSSWSGTQYSLPPEPGQPQLALKAWVTEDTAKNLASLGSQDLDALREAARVRGARPVPLSVQVSATLEQRVTRKTSPNVIGVIKGRNEKQAVIYSAHYDHLGMRDGTGDRIYNGAKDNASGVSGILEIAQAIARAPVPPGRSIYFVSTAAEEAGLLGAAYLAAHPPVAIDQVAANINVDGLNLWGRTRDVVLLGADRSTLGALADNLARARDQHLGSDTHPERGYFFRSDHFPLAKAGVPAVSIDDPTEYVGKDPDFAKRMSEEYNEKHYHQPSDEVNPTWDYSGAVDEMQFLAELGWRIAADPNMPTYKPGDQFARPRIEKKN